MNDATKIAMWSGPRNISTALMYSFYNREDCYATDEPLYANYLLSTGTPHPAAEEVIQSQETNLDVITSELNGPVPEGKKIWYQKHMCHHVPMDSDLSWTEGLFNCFLIRDPREVLLSLSKITEEVDLWSTGLPQQIRILDYVSSRSPMQPIVLDSADILSDPRTALNSLCDSIGIQFSEEMLSWEPGPRKCDGVWAKHWYSSVWESSGFYPPSKREGRLNEPTSRVLEEAIPLYQKLWSKRMIPRSVSS
ncbi:MAG: sulfotransferase family protein [Euryarchaeota archaeon]|nr:sulfotransferase family protein [Euryarchaeota archaeon]